MKKKHDGIVYHLIEVLNPTPKVTNCYNSLWVKYSFQETYMTQLVSSQPVPTMSRNPVSLFFNLFLFKQDFQQDGRHALARLIIFFFRRLQMLLRFFLNNHLL
ncbi:peroxisomal testis-specific protein 1 [Otolemur garnettii]|uniref:peroxisomal testis-specific protein 1 n=1 Tax=Otolemur garnettii TaxID=30611 RepID=UPI000C7F5ACE|nr:peroxisomal testis-specific protein 1 [Otolemur garnettii]